MAKRLISLLILGVFIASAMSVPALAKDTRYATKADERIAKMEQYSFIYQKRAKIADETATVGTVGRSGNPVSLGVAAGTSPGASVGTSWRDLQHNSTIGRMIDWRFTPQIHMAYGFQSGPASEDARSYGYNIWDPISGTYPLGAQGTNLMQSPDNGVYVNLDVFESDDGLGGTTSAAAVAGHSWLDNSDFFSPRVYYDNAPADGLGYGDFGLGVFVDSALTDSFVVEGGDVIWPKFEYQVNGTDEVTLLACYENGTNFGVINVFRKVGKAGAGTWEVYAIDTTDFPSQDITASRVSSKVAVVYVKNGTGDDGDIMYRVSNDGGATWQPKVNVTQNDPNVDGYRPWLECSALYDTQDKLHIIWNANAYTPDGGATGRACRIFHWSDQNGVGNTIFATVVDAEWSPLLADCVGGVNVLNVAKMNISECNGRLYTTFTQFNDPPRGVTDDCANLDVVSIAAAANGELYLSVSNDLQGLSWDARRNLTQTYTPGCDTVAGQECDNDHTASMARYGQNLTDFSLSTSDFPSEAQTVDPDPVGYSGTYYIDLLYQNDLMAGVAPLDETPFTRNSVKWFRLPCVDPIVAPNLSLNPTSLSYPYFLQHGVSDTRPLRVENTGNDDLTVSSITPVELSGPTGWLAVDQTTLNIPDGAPNNIDTVNVTLNAGGLVNSPGTVVWLEGRVDFEWIDDNSAMTTTTTSYDVLFPVADTLVGVAWDTISTGCIRLTIANNGNMGQAPGANEGGANLDYWGTGLDCDDADSTINDSLPGNAHVYLYDGSPVVINNADTVASWAIFGNGLASENTFKPIANEDLPEPGVWDGDNYQAYWSGQFVTVDSSITLEKTVYAPTDPDSCTFMIQAVCLYSTDGGPISGLTIGEAWDWDIPSDSGVDNIAGSDPINGIVYLQGAEYDIELTDPDLYECQDNDTRFGGAGLIGFTDASNTTLNTGDPANFYTALNSDFVIPTGGFVPAELFDNMQNNTGISTVAPTTIDDQHMVMTLFKNYNLQANDTLVFWVAMATVQNGTSTDLTNAILKARNWYDENAAGLDKRPPTSGGCCVGGTGNVNGDVNDVVDISDLTKLVNNLFVTFEPIPCPAEANTNGDANCTVDISDLTKLVNNLFVTFEPLAPCLPACQ